MPDYANGKIYTITCNKSGKRYVGSTAEPLLATRIHNHQTAVSAYKNNPTMTRCSCWVILEVDDYTSRVIEDWPCSNKHELQLRETHWFHIYKKKYGDLCVNKNVPRHTIDTFRKDARDRAKVTYWKNPDKFRQRSLQWGRNNPERHKEKNRLWRNANPDKVKTNNANRCRIMIKAHNDGRSDKLCMCEYCNEPVSYSNYGRHKKRCLSNWGGLNRINII
jgi:hypothetical protein